MGHKSASSSSSSSTSWVRVVVMSRAELSLSSWECVLAGHGLSSSAS
jgi:hypothetical protein